MSTATPVPDFERLLATLRDSGDPELSAMRMRLDSLGILEPELPRAVRLSAIPRDIDAQLLAVLRGDEDHDESERLLGVMANEGLVARSGRSYRFHDRNRGTLLRDWRSSAAGIQELAELNARLSAHALAELDGLDDLARHYARVSQLLRAADRARANRVGSVIDRRMSATLARAVRHAFASSRGEGMKVVYERIDTLLIDDRLTVAVDMLTAADSSLDRLASEDDEVLQDRAVLAYYLARVTKVDGERDIDALVAVSGDPHLPPRYRLWALDDMASDFEDRSRLTDALRVREEIVAARDGEDPWNKPAWAYSLGRLQWRMCQHRAAIKSLELSVRLAEDPASRSDLVAAAGAMLSLIHTEIGQSAAAARWAVFAVDRVRTDPEAATWNGFACRTMGNLLTTLDARASVAAWTRGLAGIDDQGAVADCCAERLFYLTAAGAVSERDLLIARLDEAAQQRAVTDPEAGQPAMARGYAAEYAGDMRGARAHFDDAVREIQASGLPRRELMIDARYGRGRTCLRSGAFDVAAADLEFVLDELADIGWMGRWSGVQIESARLALRRGRIIDCSEALESASAHIEPGTAEEASLHWVRAQWRVARGEYGLADPEYVESERIFSLLGNDATASAVATARLDLAHDRQDWPRASRVASGARHRLTALSGRAKLALSEEQLRSAIAAAAAAAQMGSPVEGASATRDDVRVRLEAAARLDPRCFWYPLELCYLLGESGRWGEARQELERALRLAPAVVRVSQLHDRVLHLAMEELTDAGGLTAESARAFDEVVVRHLTRATRTARQPAAELGVVVSALTGRTDSLRMSAGALRRRYRISDDARERLFDRLSAILTDVDGYWAIREALHELVEETPALVDPLRIVTAALDDWLSVWLGLTSGPGESETRLELAVRLEIGDDLVPVVDDGQDGGRFLLGLVPEFRERLERLTSVEVPPLRARVSTVLPADHAAVEVMGAVRMQARIGPAMCASVERYDSARHDPEMVLPWHPFDERPGPWAVMLGVDADGAESTVDAGLALIAQLELVVVRHLDQCVTVDSTVRRLARLRESRSLLAEFPDLRERCDAIEVDPALLAALTVQLRRMASEVIPLHDAALAAVLARCRDGLDDVDSVARQVLSGAVSGQERGRVVVRVPDEYLEGWADPGRRAVRSRELFAWMAEQVAERGVWLTLVAPPGVDRRELARLAAEADPLIAVLSAEEAGVT